MKIKRIMALISIVCISTQYAAQEDLQEATQVDQQKAEQEAYYTEQLKVIVKKYSGAKKDRSVFQRGAQEIYQLFLKASRSKQSEEFKEAFIGMMTEESNNLLPLKIEIYHQMYNKFQMRKEAQKNNESESKKDKVLKDLTNILPKLNSFIVTDIKPYLSVQGLLEAYKIFPLETVNYLLLEAFQTTSGNKLVTNNIINDYLKENPDLSEEQSLALKSYMRDYYITQMSLVTGNAQTLREAVVDDKQYLFVDLLLKAYVTFEPLTKEEVNKLLINGSSNNAINDLAMENIQAYLANEKGTILGRDYDKDGDVEFALNDFVRKYHESKFTSTPINPSSTISIEAQELYLEKIADILNDDSVDPQKALEALYQDAVRDESVASMQSALMKFYAGEMKGAGRIPGAVMDFCEKFMDSLSGQSANSFKQALIDVWQAGIKSQLRPTEQRLIDIFNFLSKPENDFIVAKAQMVPNLYVDAVIQSIRTIKALQVSAPDRSMYAHDDDYKDALLKYQGTLTKELVRLQNILGGSSKSMSLSDLLMKVGIGVTEEDGERNSKDQASSDLYNTSPKVWYVLADNLLDAAKTSDQLEKVEKVLKKSRKKGKFTVFKNRVSRWFNEYCTVRNLQLKWKSSGISEAEKYNLAMVEIAARVSESSINEKPLDPYKLCVSVSAVLKNLQISSNDANNQELNKLNSQRTSLLTQLQQIDGVTLDMIHEVIIDPLPKALQAQFISSLGNNFQNDFTITPGQVDNGGGNNTTLQALNGTSTSKNTPKPAAPTQGQPNPDPVDPTQGASDQTALTADQIAAQEHEKELEHEQGDPQPTPTDSDPIQESPTEEE